MVVQMVRNQFLYVCIIIMIKTMKDTIKIIDYNEIDCDTTAEIAFAKIIKD